ncbi:sugar-transfer associated ATP-grasp domain-containing protein [Maribacter aestuarii]|uniref:sugar-transfer associated ATP-grasp domain-containing protein n=1 Tax=Maribacter aestuarii TaxID=1130723 RepID=UPI0025A52D3B|nr:sugar-transfer associated ATP-grasp domain-containing protein [Maribacter aestuarii]
MNRTAFKRFKIFLKDKNKKNLSQILKEFISLWYIKKEMPLYYFKHLYKKDETNIYDYLGTKEGDLIHKSKELHKIQNTSIINNKLTFALFSKKYSLKTPILLGYHLSNQYFYQDKIRNIKAKDELLDFFFNLFENWSVEKIFVKPLDLYGGKGCFILNKDELPSQLTAYQNVLLEGSHIFSEVVEQHPKVNEIHKKSLNTLRIVTYITDLGKKEIVSTFMRFGIGDSVVDNGSAGGLYIGINEKNGTLKSYGYRTMEHGGEKLTSHPNSNYQFKNFIIPYYKEACELALNTLDYIPDRWIGWDVAITPNGPIIIEANDTPDLHMSDVAHGGLLRNNHIKNLVEKLKN